MEETNRRLPNGMNFTTGPIPTINYADFPRGQRVWQNFLAREILLRNL